MASATVVMCSRDLIARGFSVVFGQLEGTQLDARAASQREEFRCILIDFFFITVNGRCHKKQCCKSAFSIGVTPLIDDSGYSLQTIYRL